MKSDHGIESTLRPWFLAVLTVAIVSPVSGQSQYPPEGQELSGPDRAARGRLAGMRDDAPLIDGAMPLRISTPYDLPDLNDPQQILILSDARDNPLGYLGRLPRDVFGGALSSVAQRFLADHFRGDPFDTMHVLGEHDDGVARMIRFRTTPRPPGEWYQNQAQLTFDAHGNITSVMFDPLLAANEAFPIGASVKPNIAGALKHLGPDVELRRSGESWGLLVRKQDNVLKGRIKVIVSTAQPSGEYLLIFDESGEYVSHVWLGTNLTGQRVPARAAILVDPGSASNRDTLEVYTESYEERDVILSGLDDGRSLRSRHIRTYRHDGSEFGGRFQPKFQLRPNGVRATKSRHRPRLHVVGEPVEAYRDFLQVNAYYHVARALDTAFDFGLQPEFQTYFGGPLPVLIDDMDPQWAANARFSGRDGLLLNFNGPIPASHDGAVIYHETGHAIFEVLTETTGFDGEPVAASGLKKIAEFGALTEGFADGLAMHLTKSGAPMDPFLSTFKDRESMAKRRADPDLRFDELMRELEGPGNLPTLEAPYRFGTFLASMLRRIEAGDWDIVFDDDREYRELLFGAARLAPHPLTFESFCAGLLLADTHYHGARNRGSLVQLFVDMHVPLRISIARAPGAHPTGQSEGPGLLDLES